jgi:DnaK suppressor protein
MPASKRAPSKTKQTTHRQPSSGPIGFKPYKVKKGEAYMNEHQLAHFRQILQLWKQQLLQESDATKQQMQNESINFPDPLDRASQEEELNLALRTRDRELKLVKKIEEAIERIDQNDYGYCTDCGAEIGIGRLEARPTATQCIDCKTFEEIREKQTSG